jgi:hypothetical protein
MMIVTVTVNCSQHVVQVEDQDFSKCFPFIRNNITSKQEVLNRLGDPNNSYEGGRIISYFVFEDERIKLKGINCENRISDKTSLAVYNLILVFGEKDVLKRHSLIRVR